jgi:hypothetical protein
MADKDAMSTTTPQRQSHQHPTSTTLTHLFVEGLLRRRRHTSPTSSSGRLAHLFDEGHPAYVVVHVHATSPVFRRLAHLFDEGRLRRRRHMSPMSSSSHLAHLFDEGHPAYVIVHVHATSPVF